MMKILRRIPFQKNLLQALAEQMMVLLRVALLNLSFESFSEPILTLMADSLESFEPSLETFQYKRFEKYKRWFCSVPLLNLSFNPPLNLFSMAMVVLLSVPPLNLSLTLLGPALDLSFEPSISQFKWRSFKKDLFAKKCNDCLIRDAPRAPFFFTSTAWNLVIEGKRVKTKNCTTATQLSQAKPEYHSEATSTANTEHHELESLQWNPCRSKRQ